MRLIIVLGLVCILGLGINVDTATDVAIVPSQENLGIGVNLALDAIVKDGVISGGEYDNSHQLGDDYAFHYTVIGSVIHIGLSVGKDAGGWIAIGFGGTSGMNGADLAIGYYAGGTAYMRDDWGTGSTSHSADTIQNINSGFAGSGNTDQTILEFSRDLDTGDSNQDNVITSGVSTRVYWAQNRDNEAFGIGEIKDSGFENLVIKGPPTAPQSLTAVGGDSSVSLSWLAPSNDGGLPLIQYNIYRSIIQGGPYSYLRSTTSTSIVDGSLTNGQDYYYVVNVENSAGSSGDSNEATAQPSSVPSAPQNLQAIATDGHADLSWTIPSDDGGSAISNYVIYRSTIQGSLYSQIDTTPFPSYSDTTLINGITYYFVVSAVNINGEGSFSTEVSANPIGISVPPSNVQTSWSPALVSLTWDAPLNDGGNPITHYRIYRSQQSGSFTLLNGSINGLTYSDTNVTNGLTYYYVITAVNSAGESGFSAEARVTLALTPDPPGSLSIEGNPTDVTLSWLAVNGNGNSVSIYTIYRTETLGGQYAVQDTTGLLTYIDSSLVNGETYYYVVTANNSVGESSYSNLVSYFVAGTADAPSNLAIKSSRDNIRLTWTPPGYDGGSLIFNYQIYRSLDNFTFFSLNTTSVTSYIDTDLGFGTVYYYKVSAINIIGPGLNSSVANGSIFTTPNQPLNLTVSSGNAIVELSWIVPDYDGGKGIEGYRIYRSTTTGSPYVLVHVVNETTFEYNDTSVSNGLTYYYVTTAYNDAGESIYSLETVTTPATTPSPPRELLGFGNNNLVTLAWLPTLNDGGLIIKHYKIYRQFGNISEFIFLNLTSSLTYEDHNVTNGVSYAYKITSENVRGESDFSNEIIVSPENRDIEIPTDTEPAPTSQTTQSTEANTDLDLDPEKIAQDDVLRNQVLASGAAVSSVMLVFVSTKYIKRKTSQ